MDKKPFVTEEHIQTRNTFRILGPTILLIAIICLVIGFKSTFMADPMNDFYYEDSFSTDISTPSENKFWLMFVGMPLLAMGVAITKAGFVGKAAEYGAREIAPVAKETWAYIKEDEPILKQPTNGQIVSAIQCGSCHTLNPAQSKYCNGCGNQIN